MPWLLAARRKKLLHRLPLLKLLLPLRLPPLLKLLLPLRPLTLPSLLTLLRLLTLPSRLMPLPLLTPPSRLTLRQNNLQIIFRKTGPLGRFFFALASPSVCHGAHPARHALLPHHSIIPAKGSKSPISASMQLPAPQTLTKR
ncbi:hypothetical protein Herbaro_06820 [Herbaspirillum sp. WKF16]|uniref:hypothetical protein n=1 Tax=Herbaspirillum sp. WKF16 TaxID=3028312 RepID=UPI0023A98862|nr:hypothetical protein [Herbaspirillum sp. WKF16]WDZ97499.1 hypothetical protein Herbaro_06820 [Herbaspirillum sp. WKF16]